MKMESKIALAAALSVGAVRVLRGVLGWQSVTPLHTVGTVAVVACIYGAFVLLFLLRQGRRKTDEDAEPKKTEL